MKHYYVILLVILAFACKSPQNSCIDAAKINKEAICTMQYEPVCGCDNKTYGNDCQAENAGVTSFKPGACPE